MKAWFVWADNVSYESWGDYVHAETAGKAKSAFWDVWGTDLESFCDLRPVRVPELDDKPLTKECITVTRWFDDAWDAPIICKCELCAHKEG